MQNARESRADILNRIPYEVAVLFHRMIEVRDTEPHAAALNMALDEVLLLRAAVPTLRIYLWERPAVSFGYFGRYGEIAAQWPGRELVRRWTGGGVVAHGDDLTYSLLVPANHALAASAPLAAYGAIHETISRWLQELGHHAELATASEAASGECFASPVAHDVLANGRKVAGGAQRRTRHGLLHQGSIQGVAGLMAARGTLAAACAHEVARRDLEAEELRAAEELVEAKYGREDWLRRW